MAERKSSLLTGLHSSGFLMNLLIEKYIKCLYVQSAFFNLRISNSAITPWNNVSGAFIKMFNVVTNTTIYIKIHIKITNKNPAFKILLE